MKTFIYGPGQGLKNLPTEVGDSRLSINQINIMSGPAIVKFGFPGRMKAGFLV
jgi:hypothetical protein